MTYIVEKDNFDAALPYKVIFTGRNFNKVKGRYATESEAKTRARSLRSQFNRKARHQAMLDLGLVKVKGALGGTYYE